MLSFAFVLCILGNRDQTVIDANETSKNVRMAASERLAEGIDDIETHVCLATTVLGFIRTSKNIQDKATILRRIHWDSAVQKSCNRRGEGSFALVLPSTKKGDEILW